jgi:tetratricopeptide (TPR) repeat protein
MQSLESLLAKVASEDGKESLAYIHVLSRLAYTTLKNIKFEESEQMFMECIDLVPKVTDNMSNYFSAQRNLLISYQDYDIEAAYKLTGDLADREDLSLFHDYWLLAANVAYFITERDEAIDIIEQSMTIFEDKNAELESNILKGMMVTNLGYMYLQDALSTSDLLMRKIEKPKEGDESRIFNSKKTPILYRMAIKMLETDYRGQDELVDRLL